MRFFKYIFIFLLFSPAMFSCADDLMSQEDYDKNKPAEEHEEDGATYLDVFIEDFGVKTRAISFEEHASVRIHSLWLGIFDIYTGECVEKVVSEQGFKFLTSGEMQARKLRVNFKGPKDSYSGNGKFFMVALANYNGQTLDDGTTPDAVLGRDGREAAKGIDKLYTLADLLEKVETWEDFNHIGVETKSAYEGDHQMDSPVMAGFMNSISAYQANIPSSTHIKIDQFASTSENNMVKLLPEKLLTQTSTTLMDALKIKWNAEEGRYVDNETGATKLDHAIFFRRLVANINVIIKRGIDSDDSDVRASSDEHLEILSAGYRRFNIPNDVYIIERSLLQTANENGTGQFPTSGNLSPNFADIDPSLGYSNDDDTDHSIAQSIYSEKEPYWFYGNMVDAVRKDEFNNSIPYSYWNINYQHFANKHWARYTLNGYPERESFKTIDGKKYFTALCSTTENGSGIDLTDINNNASYIIMKLHLLNKMLNRCAEVEYTIHEGYTSDSQGYGWDHTPLKSHYTTEDAFNDYILQDYSVARNIDYKINVHVKKFDQIITNTNDGENVSRRHDVGGKVWQMHYTGENFTLDQKNNSISDFRYKNDEDHAFTKYLSNKGGIYKNAITINSSNPNLAFRIYGYNSEKVIDGVKGHREGYNFNFPDNSFNWLLGLWPPSAGTYSHYFMNEEALFDDYFDDTKESIDNLLFNTFQLIAEEDYQEGRKDVYLVINKDGDRIGYTETTDKKAEIIYDISNPEKNYWMDVVQFVHSVNTSNAAVNKTYHIMVAPRKQEVIADYNANKAVKKEPHYVRALYIGDRNGKKDPDDGCSTLVDIFATVQGIDDNWDK